MTGRQFARTAGVAFAAVAALAAQNVPSLPMSTIAERYVRLVLAVGQHDADYVDAFYGPAEWKAESERRKLSLRDVDAEAGRLIADLPPLSDADRRDELVVLRRDYLARQLEALRGRVRMLEGTTLTSTRSRGRFMTPSRQPTPNRISPRRSKSSRRCCPVMHRLSSAMTHSARNSSSRTIAFHAPSIVRSPNAGRAHCRTCSCRRRKRLRSSTSPINHGAATTGTRAGIAA